MAKLGKKGVVAQYLFRLGFFGDCVLAMLLLLRAAYYRVHLWESIVISDHSNQMITSALKRRADLAKLNIVSTRPTMAAYVAALKLAIQSLRRRERFRSSHFVIRYHAVTYVISYWMYYLTLRRLNTAKAILVDDFTARQTALFAACTDREISVMVVSLHHQRKDPYLPPVRCAVYLHWGEFDDAALDAVSRKHLRLQTEAGKVRLAALHHLKKARLGMVLGGQLPPAIRNKIERYCTLGSTLLIRPHPRYDGGVDLSVENTELIAANTQSLADFSAGIDLAICGNTSAIPDILAAGCPVIYDAQLDLLVNDAYGYVRDGLVPDISILEKSGIRGVIEFYELRNANIVETASPNSKTISAQVADSIGDFLNNTESETLSLASTLNAT
jgi:hypothetical protein